MTAWRIVKRKHARTAFTGDGARRFGGRWNRPGTAVVYAAGFVSLAALEMLVHLASTELMSKYVVFPLSILGRDIHDLSSDELPKRWRADPAPAKVQSVGSDWVVAGTSAVLRVPSAVIPTEFNYLLNPAHPRFGRIQIGLAQPFTFDPRLARGSATR